MDDDELVAARQRVSRLEARMDVLLGEPEDSRGDAWQRLDVLIGVTEELIEARGVVLERRRVLVERPLRRTLVLTLGGQPVLALAVLVSAVAGFVSWNVGVVVLIPAAVLALWLAVEAIPPNLRNCAASVSTAVAFVATTLAAVGTFSLWWLLATVPAWVVAAAWLELQVPGQPSVVRAVMTHGR